MRNLEQQIVLHNEIIIDGELSIYDVKGALVFNKKLKGGNIFVVDAKEWKNGMYVIHFSSANSNTNQRIIKF